jgi:thioredoxin-like negative regulator of GroEL
MKTLQTLDQAQALTQQAPIALLYFSGPDCGVCHSLKPKVEELLTERFPRIAAGYIDLAQLPQASGEYQVFAVPTVICYFDGREGPRFSRAFGLGELGDALARVYDICFS